MTELVRVMRGVWRPSETVDDLAAMAAAVVGASPDGTVVAGVTAAQLHGLWLPDLGTRPIELILRNDAPVPEAHSGSRRRELRGRRRRLHPDELVLLGGLPITSIERTWMDLAEYLGLADLIAAGDSALRSGVSALDLRRVIGRAVHRRGVVRARAAVPLLNARSRSRPESHLRYTVVSGGLPEPAVNEPIFNAEGEWLAEPDLSYDDVKLALEYNGALHGTAQRMRRDITRAVDIASRGGWRTVTFGPAEVFGRPDQVVSLVRELRRLGGPRGR
jgi:hypothetical protein